MIYTFFSLDIYDRLSIKSKELLIDKKEYLKTFSLGNIPLSYNKKYKEFYEYFNNNKVNKFLTTLINYIKYNNYMYNKQVMAYLYGMIINYGLSTNINPYIIYYGGVNKYNIVNNHIDNFITRLKTNNNPYRFKGYKECFNIDYFDKELIEVINFTYKEVFKIDNFSKDYLESIKKMKRFYRIYRYDRFGIKKLFYFKNRYLSLHTKSNDSYLNLNHNIWYNPTNKRVHSNMSFIELYLKSLHDTSNMINEINQYIYYDKKIKLDKVLGNNSYITGRDINKEKELKFFN